MEYSSKKYLKIVFSNCYIAVMNLFKNFYFLFFLLSILFLDTSFAQLSKKHFIPPLTYAEFGNANPEDQYLYISTPSSRNINFTIKPVGSLPSEFIIGTVSKNNPKEIFIGNGSSQLFVNSPLTSKITNNKGYIIEANDVVYVSVRMLAGNSAQAGALVSKGLSALGKTFRVGSFTNENPQDNYLNFVSVMASENNTIVTFDDLPAGISIKNYTGTLPITITLNEGESYIIATNSSENTTNRDGLIGTLVESDKPIVVNCGSANGSFHNGNGRDYGIDQIVGVTKIGSEYIFVKGDGQDGWENALIVAHEDNTEIRLNGNTTVTSLINAGEYYLIEGDQYNSNGNLYVSTSKPVFAYQGVGASNSEANQGLFFVPPLSCENKGKVDEIPNIQNIGTILFTGGITVVTNKNATVTINTQPIADFNTVGPFDVDGNTDYVTYKVTGLNDNITIESTGELYCAYFNFNGAATSGSFYSGFPSAPEINFETNVATLGNCIPNLTLEAANTELFDSFEWFYFDETLNIFQGTNIRKASFKPLNPGRYKLIAVIDCNNEIFESVEVPVSICPDDYDGDGIIDNIDVDIDNDGILNCDESKGNATINLLDASNPIINFQDGESNTTIANGIISNTGTGSAGTFKGQNNGDFISTLNTGNSSDISYEVNFNQKINIEFKQNATTNHTIVADEFFTVTIGPNDKNITLLDPDDVLIIDTNFDGDYKSGITQISASEIRFKYNNNPAGTTSFKFVGNQIDRIKFTHNSNNISIASTFNGNIQLTCFSLDSDGDGIENMFDLDSDNDGIPDIYEATAQNIILLNTDTNQDGLDDAFNGVITNSDTDNDGILNYLDLDSDNDGILDSTEANHNLDADFDGRVDNANAIIGLNGFVDNLEITPDSKSLSIKYTIADTDGDNIFNFVELDADNDECNDVIEAGFTDQNNDGYLGDFPLQVDANGIVTSGIDGYTIPNSNYTTAAPIEITKFEDTAFCEEETNTITITSNATIFKWQVSTDGGTTFTDVVDNATRYNGSTTKDLIISEPPLSFNNFQYKVILGRNGNTCGKTTGAIKLSVNPKPIVPLLVELKQCDTNADKITIANLTEAEINLSTAANLRFEYFETEGDAITGAPQVADKISYPVNGNIPQSAWVRTISEFNCYTISRINLFVSFTPNQPYEETFSSCDDFLDADGNDTAAKSDTDGIAFFDFSTAPNQINTDPDIEIEFYETENDRTQSVNKIQDTQNIAQYRNKNIPNTTGNRFPIFYKLISKTNNDCSGIGQIYLRVDLVPIANSAGELKLCDNINDGNGTNGIVQTFDLEGQTPIILGTQSATNFTVTYHASALEANSGANSLASPYTNTNRDSQTIFVRVTNNTTNCFTDHTSFDIIVDPLPIVNFVKDLEVCDDNSDGSARNGFSQTIDLESQSSTILGSQNPAVFNVTYHISLADAQAGNNPLVSPYSNSTTDRETIFVRVFNQNTQCANGISNFDVIINPEPIFEVISNLSYCDNDNDGDDTNGIIQSIDLDSKIPEILGASQNSGDYNVTFHSSQLRASSGANPIASPYTNSIPTETIFVRIQHKRTMCVNDDAFFDVIINPLPDIEIILPQIVCLNRLPLTITLENPQNERFVYEWKNSNGDIISNIESADITSAGNYKIKATKTDGTECRRIIDFQVDASIIATITINDITVIDDADNNSISINNTNQNLGIGNYKYALENSKGNIVRDYQFETIFENLEGDIYTVLVRDENGCGDSTPIQVPVVEFMKFFTPNGDGTKDRWILKGANTTFFPNSEINIFNRFGKLVGKIPLNSQGWDGTSNDKLLPSNDYWFSAKLIDLKGNIREKTGHFSLLNN